MTAKGYHPAVLIAQGCTGCGICAIVCHDAAITVYRIRAGEKLSVD